MELYGLGFGLDGGRDLMKGFGKALGGYAYMGHMHIGRTFSVKDI